jgi:LacI family transcriptional regulator
MIAMSRKTNAVTLAHIAARAGVAPITVSRALRGGTLVAKTTRERILAAAAELCYVPNLLARGLIHNRTSTIGVIIIELANPFFAPMLSSIETAAAKRDFLVMIGESGRNEERERKYVERFQQLRIAGIIVTPSTKRMDHLAALRESGTGVVVMSRRWADGDYVTSDHSVGGQLVAQHLLSRGHRRIGLISCEASMGSSFFDRIKGFHRFLASATVLIPPAWVLHTSGNRIEDGENMADAFLALRKRPSAIFALTDRLAMGFTHRLLSRGIRIPEDIAVIGYDDIPFASHNQIPLTTVKISVQRMGELAAEVLFDRIGGTREPGNRHIRLSPELVIRASCP